jgi:hypothetical protein
MYDEVYIASIQIHEPHIIKSGKSEQISCCCCWKGASSRNKKELEATYQGWLVNILLFICYIIIIITTPIFLGKEKELLLV